jgi:hypothetical protein
LLNNLHKLYQQQGISQIRAKKSNRKSNREQQIVQLYPKTAKILLGSWTGVNMGRISMSPIQKLVSVYVSAICRHTKPLELFVHFWTACVIIQVIMCHRCEGLIPHRQSHLCPQAAIELAKVLLRVSVTSWSWKQRFRTKLQTTLNKIKQVTNKHQILNMWKLCDTNPAWDVLTSPGSGICEGSNPGKF